MAIIRPLRDEDAIPVGQLIADTYTKFNLATVPREKLALYLGPFAHAYSTDQTHQKAIAEIIQADMVFVAEVEKKIAGVLRGRQDKLQSLFVSESFHRQGIGRKLVQTFEQACREQHATTIKVMATLYAVPFYRAIGYKRTTGVRRMTSFEGTGLPLSTDEENITGDGTLGIYSKHTLLITLSKYIDPYFYCGDQMKKLLLAVWLLFGGLAVFVLGSPYYRVFPTNRNQIYSWILTIFLLLIAILLKKLPKLSDYWSSAYALFIASAAILFLNTGLLNIRYDGPNALLDIALDKVSQFLHIVPVILILTFLAKENLKSLFIARGDLKQGLTFGIISFIIFAVIGFIMQASAFDRSQWRISNIFYLLVFVFANATMEELWFRGIFLNKYTARIGRLAAILITSVIFGASHINATYAFPGGGIVFGIVVFILGYAGADAMLKTNSIIGPVLFHAGYDLMIIIPVLNSI